MAAAEAMQQPQEEGVLEEEGEMGGPYPVEHLEQHGINNAGASSSSFFFGGASPATAQLRAGGLCRCPPPRTHSGGMPPRWAVAARVESGWQRTVWR